MYKLTFYSRSWTKISRLIALQTNHVYNVSKFFVQNSKLWRVPHPAASDQTGLFSFDAP